MSAVTNKIKGFTIMEALIYIALFSFIISSGLFTALQIFEGSAQVQKIALREIELNFVLRKIDWILNDAVEVTIPSSNTLQVLHADGQLYELISGGSLISLVKNGVPYNLSTPRLNISDINFSLSGTDNKLLEVTFTRDGQLLEPITYFLP
jgi:hypothetical protein